jgi:hypothetical protein
LKIFRHYSTAPFGNSIPFTDRIIFIDRILDDEGRSEEDKRWRME